MVNRKREAARTTVGSLRGARADSEIASPQHTKGRAQLISSTLEPAITVVEVTPHEITVRIKNVPHLILRRSDVIGLQGYVKNVGPIVPIHFIEIATRSGEIVCDYADRGLWEQILVGLADARVFDERLGERT